MSNTHYIFWSRNNIYRVKKFSYFILPYATTKSYTIPTYIPGGMGVKKKIGPPYRRYITKVIFIQCEYFKMEYITNIKSLRIPIIKDKKNWVWCKGR